MRGVWGARDHKGIGKTANIDDYRYLCTFLPVFVTLSSDGPNFLVPFTLGLSNVDAGGEQPHNPFALEWQGDILTKL